MNLEKLRELRAAAFAKCESIKNKAETEQRTLTDEERTSFDEALAEVDRLDADIKRAEQFEQRAAANPQPQQRRPNPDTGTVTVHDNREDAPFRSFGDQLIAIRNAAEDRTAIDPRLRRYDLQQSQVRAAAGLNETVASDGGFLVMTDVASGLTESAFGESRVWSEADDANLTSNANALKLHGIDETSRVNGSRSGGVQAYWQGEADTITATKPKFGEMELSLKKLTGLCYITDEAMEDAGVIEGVTRRAFTKEFAFKLDDAAMRGTGAGMPLGIMNAGCVISVSKETSQAANTILYANVSKMRSRMFPGSYLNAFWFVNIDCMPQIEQLAIPVKNVAGTENVGGLPVFVNGNASNTPFGMLLGRPIVPIEQCETVGTTGDIVLADMDYYQTISKGGVKSAVSIHVKFLTAESAFRFILRADGQPKLKSPVTPYKGTNTLSPFVTLATRS